MIYETSPISRTCWSIARAKGAAIAEIRLCKGVFTVEPLKKLTKKDSSMIAVAIADLRLEACGEPPQRSTEARLGRLDEEIDRVAGYLEDAGDSPELVEALDAFAVKLQEERERLRLQRGQSEGRIIVPVQLPTDAPIAPDVRWLQQLHNLEDPR